MKNIKLTGKAAYLIAGPKAFSTNLSVERKIGGHCTSRNNGVCYIWPESITAAVINPPNMRKIKTKCRLDRLLIIDLISSIDQPACIVGHVNRSGMNFLVGRTPYDNHPQFPDISQIYQKFDDLKAITVQTVGPQRFSQYLDESQKYWSEGVAICAPVAHYIGLSVEALGMPLDMASPLDEIEKRFFTSK